MSDSSTDLFQMRSASPGDFADIARIYNYFIRETIITFEEVEVSAATMGERVRDVQDAGYEWLVAELDGRVVGYAYANRWKGRCAYRESVELTVYVDVLHPRKGIGSGLYRRLLENLETTDAHAIIGGVALPNEASEALHASLGFERVAHFKEVGFKQGRYIDVAYWELILKREGR